MPAVVLAIGKYINWPTDTLCIGQTAIVFASKHT